MEIYLVQKKRIECGIELIALVSKIRFFDDIKEVIHIIAIYNGKTFILLILIILM